MGDAYCAGCGRPAAECAGCTPAFDPPRFCATCGRRLTVRVSPAGWRARCNRCEVETASTPVS
jgi:rRNA maturation endonuclease Nob1